MRRYVLRRLGLAVPTLGLVSVIVFGMMRLMPGDVVTRMVEGQAYAPTIEALRKELRLDRPVIEDMHRPPDPRTDHRQAGRRCCA